MGKECFGPIPIVLPSLPNLPALRPNIIPPSSSAPDYTTTGGTDLEPPKKRRKKERACDYCRHRKVKCDGPCMRNNVCSNCINGSRVCTYLESSRPRGPTKTYITTLEDRMERLEGALKQFFPNIDFTPELGPSFVRGSWKDNAGRASQQTSEALMSEPSSAGPDTLAPPAILLNRIHPSNHTTPMNLGSPVPSNSRAFFQYTSYRSSSCVTSSDDSSNESEEETIETGLNGRQKLFLSAFESSDSVQPDKIRFHGRSSTAALIETTRRFKQMCVWESQKQVVLDNEQADSGPRVVSQNDQTPLNAPDNDSHWALRRNRFWSQPQWERTWDNRGPEPAGLLASILKYFPEDEVATRLFELYFIHTNAYLPLLHRPTFQLHREQKLHRTNLWFSTVCLMMCAVASRWFEEDCPASGINWKVIGWEWFLVVLDIHRMRKSSVCAVTLFEVQTVTLMSMFLRGTMHGPTGWFLTSIGIRTVQDRGAHRKNTYKAGPNVDDELWKRAFWILLAFDHIIGASLGRGPMIGEEDYDLDLPLEIDDEYWDTGDPELDFKQPPGVPSRISCFIQYIKLSQLIAFTAKALYPLSKNKVIFGLHNDHFTDAVVSKLKAAIEEWSTNVPQHIRWPEASSDLIFTEQSATIYSLYHTVQMMMWRQFCVCYPSAPKYHQYALSTCASSIRAVARILELQTQKGVSNIPNMINVALVCAGTVAIISSELRKKATQSELGDTSIQILTTEGRVSLQDLLDDLQICIKMLRGLIQRWEWAEAVLDNLTDVLPSDAKNSSNLPAALSNKMPPIGLHSDIGVRDFYMFEGGTSSSRQHRVNDKPLPTNEDLYPSYTTCLSQSDVNQSHDDDTLIQGKSSSQLHSDSGSRFAHLPEFHLQLPALPSSAPLYQENKQQFQSYHVSDPRMPSYLPTLQGIGLSTSAPVLHQLPSKGHKQAKDPTLQQPRMRAMSITSDSGPGANIQNISIPHISNSLRRVSYPNLRILSNDNVRNPVSMVGISRELDCLRNPFNPIGQTVNMSSVDQARIGKTVDLTPTSDINRQLNSGRAKPIPKKFKTWGNDITYYVPDKNDFPEKGKILRSTEFRHWTQYPTAPVVDSQGGRSTRGPTEHRFIQEMPFSR